jgi:hypothetical protein
VKKSDDHRRNIFYYTDDSRKKLKRFNPGTHGDIPIYFKNENEIEFISSGELLSNN